MRRTLPDEKLNGAFTDSVICPHLQPRRSLSELWITVISALSSTAMVLTRWTSIKQIDGRRHS